MVAIASLLMLGTSCSSEEVAPVTGESAVTLSVTLPDGIQSRAFGDGTTADSLTMLVLDGETALPVFTGTDPTVLSTDINLTKQVTLRLAAGKTYKVVCWASAKKSPYTFDTATRKVSAKYEDALTSDEALDAFYAAQDITVTGNTTETVKLYRPFAQLNIGTNDLAAAKAAGFDAKTVKVTVPTYKSLNLVTGAVELGDPVAVPFGDGALPTGETFPKAGYDYLSMNYLLMSADKQLVDLEFTVKAADGSTRTLPVSAVPVQRNYRTNIYGSLLTNSVNINVEIIPDFEGEPYERFAAMDLIVNALNNGNSVTLSEDLVLPLPSKGMVIAVPEGKTATLNLNGKTISNDEDLWDYTNAMMNVKSGTLVLTGKGKLDAKENDCYCINVRGGAHLIIENGTYVGNVSAIQVDEGVCEIKGGVFNLKQVWTPNFLLNCIDANYKNGKAKFIVTGGTFTGFNPADNKAEGAGTNFVADGYGAIRTTYQGKEAWKVVKLTEVTSLEDIKKAKAGSNLGVNSLITMTNPMMSYKKGLNLFLNEGGEIALDNTTTNLDFNQTIFVGTTLNVYGNGGKVTAPAYTTEGNGASAFLVQGGTLNIYGNGTYEGGSGSTANYAVRITKGTANIYGGYFHIGLDKDGKSGEVIYLNPGWRQTAVCNIYGGVFECEGDASFLININKAAITKSTIKIYGGIFVGFNPADNNADGEHTKYVAEGYKANKITYNGKEAYQVVKA